MKRRLVAVGLTLVAGTVVHAQQGVFRARTDVVAIDVSVRDATKPVAGLTIGDFHLTDAGVTQALLNVGSDPMPLDVTLTIDVSNSMTADKQATIERAIRQVSATLKPDDRCSVVSFETHVLEESPLHHPPLAVRLTRRPGNTSLIDTLLLSMVSAPVVGRRQFNLILTDGIDTSSFFDTDRVKQTMKYASGQTSVILVRGGRKTIGENPAIGLLNDVAGTTGGQVVALEQAEGLSAAFLAALDEFRMSYLLTFTPTGVSREGWHPVVVTVPGHRYTVRARQGYWFAR